MPITLEELANKGLRKYKAKIDTMKTDYAAAKDEAIEAYNALPFGPTRKANYRKAWDEYAIPNYQSKMTPEVADKWKRRWIEAMSK